MEEKEIARGCKLDDARAQRALFESTAPQLLALITRYIGQEDAAQDVLQDTFVRAFSSFDKFEWRGPGSLMAWLKRMAVNMALNQLRSKNRQGLVSTELTGDIADTTPNEPSADEVAGIDADTIMQLVSELPVGYRTVFNLYCIEGYSHKQIAETLGINEKSSSSQLARAKALLAQRIKAYLKENG